MATIKAIVFDFYGVLYLNLDWDVIVERVYSNPEKFTKMRKLVDQINRGKLSNTDFAKEVAILAEDDKHPDKQAVLDHPTVNHPLLKLIKELAKDYRIALLSNGLPERINELLEEEGVKDLFEAVLSSSELGYSKPDPEIYHALLKRLNLNADEVIVVDDSVRHVAGAEAAGIKAVRYEDQSQAEGELKKALEL